MADQTGSWRRRWLDVRPIALLSDIRFGVSVLTLIVLYGSIGSAAPKIRGAVELTETQYFNHWLFGLLLGVFCLSLVLATVLRVRWKPTNIGVLTTHVGLLVLAGGGYVYFSGKVQGDVFVAAPRVEIVAVDAQGRQREIHRLPLAAGAEWNADMPGLGAQFMAKVEAVAGGPTTPTAHVLVTLNGEQHAIDLNTEAPIAAVSDRLRVRLGGGAGERLFYEDERPALYWRALGAGDWRSAALATLPAYRERLAADAVDIRDTLGRTITSKRHTPSVNLFGVSIPTGWFEPWRLPIRVDADDLPFEVSVDSYLPYVTATVAGAADGGDARNPAAVVLLQQGGGGRSATLWADEPTRRFADLSTPVEFVWTDDPATLERLSRSQVGPQELHIEVRDPALTMTVAAETGKTIEIPEAGYSLTIAQTAPRWPLMTPGYEGALTAMASVDVRRGELTYSRTVLERYPELSQDIDAEGVRHTDGPVDPNLVLTYRSSVAGRLVIVAGPAIQDGAARLIAFAPDGQARSRAVNVGESVSLDALGLAGAFQLAALYERATPTRVPVVEILDRRRPSMSARSQSAVRLRLTGKGPLAGWEQTRWCLFNEYVDCDEPGLRAETMEVQTPDGGRYEFVYSRARRDLGAEIGLEKLTVALEPGRDVPTAWRSDLWIRDGGGVRDAVVQTNDTHALGPWTLYQSGADNTDRWSWSIIGVGNRGGVLPMFVGSLMITAGMAFAFYVKPVLKRRRKAAQQAQPAMEGAR